MPTIIDKIVKSKKLPILFIGSGISKRYIHDFPSWEELLIESFEEVDSTNVLYSRNNNKLLNENISNFERYKKLATIVETEYNAYYFDNLKKQGKTAPGWAMNKSPYKMYIKQRFDKLRFINKPYLKTELDLFGQLNGKISAIITTNYDCLLEKHVFCEDFDVFTNQHELFDAKSNNINEIYKIHGSITDIDSLVLTDKDYTDFANNRKLVIAKMLTLFIDSPIIFMGYSMEDENIRSIILDFLSCLNKEQIEKISEHFIFVEYKKNERYLLESKEQISIGNSVIPITKISTDNFIRLFRELNKITPGLSTKIIKKTKRVIKRLVDEALVGNGDGKIIFTTDDIESVPSDELAIAIGYKDTIVGQYGYTRINPNDLFEDILYNNKGFNPILLIKQTFLSINRNTLTPFFKYSKEVTEDERKNYNHLEKFYVRGSYEGIYTANIRKSFSKIPILDSITVLNDHVSTLDNNINKIFSALGKNIEHFTSDQIRDFCIEYYQKDSTMCLKSTFFKRAVMYLDLIENAK